MRPAESVGKGAGHGEPVGDGERALAASRVSASRVAEGSPRGLTEVASVEHLNMKIAISSI